MKDKFLLPSNKKTYVGTPLEKRFISRKELKDLVMKELQGKFDDNFGLHGGLYIADCAYYCPPIEDARKVIEGSKIKEISTDLNVLEDRFDCDDFALLLKARFSWEAYRNKQNYPHCFGIVWGMLPLPFPHSLNWMVVTDKNEEKKLYFVEPQTYEIFPPRDGDKAIYFMLV